MAYEARIEVFEGPSKWDMLLNSLLEGQVVRFRLSGWMTITASDYYPGKLEWIDARIMSVSRSGENKYSCLATSVWVIEAELLVGTSKFASGLVLSGTYSTRDRHGNFTVTERDYLGGDEIFRDENRNWLKASDVIRFLNPSR